MSGAQWNERSNASLLPMEDIEAMFRLLFERSADAMSLFDPQANRFIGSNEAVARQTGAPSIEALGKATPAEISPERQPDGRLSIEKAAEMARIALANGSHRFEWMSRRYDGRELPLDLVMTAIPINGRTLLFTVSRDISAQKNAEREVLELNASLEKRIAERTAELVRANELLKRAEEEARHRGRQLQKHRDVLLELARCGKSDWCNSLELICARAVTTLDVARVSYWSLEKDDSAIVCQLFYLRNAGMDENFQGVRLNASDCPAYFEALATKRPIVAMDVLTHPATRSLADSYLKPAGITSMLDAPVWVRGEVVGVLCHEHIGPARDWSAEEVDFASALGTMVSLALEESQRTQSENQLRESEAKFRALFEGTSQPVVLHDADGIFEANPSWFQYLGYSKLEEVRGRQPFDLSAPIQPGGEQAKTLAKKHMADALAHGSARFEWVVLRKNGEPMPIEVFLTPIRMGGRQVMQAVFNDISERKRAEAELLKTLAREKELGQLRSNFVSMVSHEFRTPLGIIQSSAEILENYFKDLDLGERQDHLQSIQNNTRRMAGLMEEVLLLGSFDAGKKEFNPAPLDLAAFARRLIDEVLSATCRQCQIILDLVDLTGEARADERLLRHMFTNLLVNAVKYSHATQAARFQMARCGREVICEIRDHGIGIPEADQEWLFNPFHRGRNVGERPGTGLGLVIVKRCVDLHGGKVQVVSKQGEGTTVTVRLPVFSDHRDGAALHEGRKSPGLPTGGISENGNSI